MIALAYSFGVESMWIWAGMIKDGIYPMLIVCRSHKDHLSKSLKVLLKGTNHKVIRRLYQEDWHINESPHGWSVTDFTNTILEWAKDQPTRPFDTLCLGRRLEDMKLELERKDAEFSPPTNAFGFELKFPLWNWRRIEKSLFPPTVEVKVVS